MLLLREDIRPTPKGRARAVYLYCPCRGPLAQRQVLSDLGRPVGRCCLMYRCANCLAGSEVLSHPAKQPRRVSLSSGRNRHPPPKGRARKVPPAAGSFESPKGQASEPIFKTLPRLFFAKDDVARPNQHVLNSPRQKGATHTKNRCAYIYSVDLADCLSLVSPGERLVGR